MRWVGLAALCAAAVACGTLLQRRVRLMTTGRQTPRRSTSRPAPAPGAVSFERQVRPLLERRCVVCHACYDAPCQLKLTSWDGIARGGIEGAGLQGPAARGARPPGCTRTPRLHVGVARARLLPGPERARPGPRGEPGGQPAVSAAGAEAPAPDAGRWRCCRHRFELSLDAERKCPRLEQHAGYEKDQPLWGMPYGMPPLDDAEHALLERWLAAGAPAERAPAVAGGGAEPGPAVGGVLQRRLAASSSWSRATCSSTCSSRTCTSRAIRSGGSSTSCARGRRRASPSNASPPGGPMTRPACRGCITAWSSIPRASSTRRTCPTPSARHGCGAGARCSSSRATRSLPCPAYDPDDGGEPVRRVPRAARAGTAPVPAGRRPLPHHDFHQGAGVPGPGRPQRHQRSLLDRVHRSGRSGRPARPSSSRPSAGSCACRWRGRARTRSWRAGGGTWRARRRTCRRSPTFWSAQLGPEEKVDLDLVWDGDGVNPNAALTVFRNFDAATVVTGLVGPPPKTTWVLSYPLFERISLSAGRGLRRVRQRRPPAGRPPVHGFSAHGGRVQSRWCSCRRQTRSALADQLVSGRRGRGAEVRVRKGGPLRPRTGHRLPHRRSAAASFTRS